MPEPLFSLRAITRSFPGVIANDRFLPDNAGNGIVINYLPNNTSDFDKFASGTLEKKVTQFRIVGPGAVYFQKSIGITWMKATTSMK